MNNSIHPLFHKVCNITGLSQVVTGHTHVSPNGNTTLIDLVLTSSPSQVLDCSVIPPLATSDHNGLHLNISWKAPLPQQQSHVRRRTVWRYAHADFGKASAMINDTDWDALISEDIDQYCSDWQNTFMSIMDFLFFCFFVYKSLCNKCIGYTIASES